MEPTRADKKAAKANPWKLTAHQCMALRLVCEHGTAKRVEYVTDISHKVIEHHLHNARRAMGLFGTTLHLYLNWDRWTHAQGENK